MVGSPCSPEDSQESFPIPQFKSINFSWLSLLYGPTLTSVHDYWKNHSFDYTDLCWQSKELKRVLLFNMLPRFIIAFIPRSKHLLINYRLNKCHVLVTQSYPTLCHPVDYSLPGSSVHGILQARILEWVAISFSRGSSQPRDRTQVSSIAGGFFTI